jgi:VIT1/CCC1 family predicted Fe2+/Mn2+ transporter
MRHRELHRASRVGWLRAAVLGANDGLISTASLVVGVAASAATRSEVLVAGVAGLVAGALSMAAGEYVSVSSQSDTEQADLARERNELATDPESEHAELANIYVSRGVEPGLADQVATQMMRKDALEAHARDELGMSDITMAKPLQAAWASAATFAAGAVMPLLAVMLLPDRLLVPGIIVAVLLLLTLLGGLAAKTGGAPMGKGILRVTFWGLVAMAVTAGVGRLFGAVA